MVCTLIYIENIKNNLSILFYLIGFSKKESKDSMCTNISLSGKQEGSFRYENMFANCNKPDSLDYIDMNKSK